MSTTLLLALICAGGVLLFFIGISRTPTTNTAQMVQQRLSVYGGEKPLTVEEIELQRPFSERVLRPAIERLGSLLSRSTPQKARQDVLNRLELAGRPGNLTPEDFMAVRLVAAAVFAAIGLLLGLLLGNVVYLVISLVLGTILGYYAPVLWLKQKVDARRAEVMKGLPDALDLLVICVDAGLGFDAALARVTDKYKNALSDLLAKALLVALRLFGKREVGQFTLFDLVFILLVANALQPAITGPDTSLGAGFILIATLVGMNFLVGKLDNLPRFHRLFTPAPAVIMRDGKYLIEVMRREGVDQEEAEVAVRGHGIADTKEVQLAVLEPDGTISFDHAGTVK